MHTCPLCHQSSATFFHQDKLREYWQCPRCQLVFVPQAQLITKAHEYAQYDLHQNNAADEGYQHFIGKLTEPLKPLLPPNALILDYGCGPDSPLKPLLEQYGHTVLEFDPYFKPSTTLPSTLLDAITCTEAIEHFHKPGQIWQQWLRLLKPGGLLAVMTQWVISKERFATWQYKNDPTHVCFFSQFTFEWLALQSDLSIEFCQHSRIILRKAVRH